VARNSWEEDENNFKKRVKNQRFLGLKTSNNDTDFERIIIISTMFLKKIGIISFFLYF
jgi:hypothetical protein